MENNCTICKKIFEESYIEFPCNEKHRFCVDCMTKIVEVTPNGFSVTCNRCHFNVILADLEGFEIYEKKVIQERKINWTSGVCPFHSKILIYFCTDCLEPICASCKDGVFHSQHGIDAFETVYNQTRSEFIARMKEIESSKGTLEKDLENLLNRRENYPNDIERLRNQLTNEFDLIKLQLAQKEAELLQQLNNIEQSNLNLIDKKSSTAFQLVDDFNEVKNIAEDMLKTNLRTPLEQFQIFYEKQHLFEGLDIDIELKVPEVPNINNTLNPIATIKTKISEMRIGQYYKY